MMVVSFYGVLESEGWHRSGACDGPYDTSGSDGGRLAEAEAGWDCKFHTGTLGLEVLLQGSSAASLLLS